jgi:hypothetical protein
MTGGVICKLNTLWFRGDRGLATQITFELPGTRNVENVARALVDGEVVRDSFADEHILDQRLRDMVARTNVRAHDDRTQANGVRIEIQSRAASRSCTSRTASAANSTIR